MAERRLPSLIISARRVAGSELLSSSNVLLLNLLRLFEVEEF